MLPWSVALATLAVLGVALRLIAARGDLWIDEIWSLNFARSAGTVLDVFTDEDLRHDNNHPLSTCYLMFVAWQTHEVVYRLLSVTAGAGTVLIAGLLGRRRSRLEGLLAAMLVAVCFILVVYGSEARGYAPAVFFAFATVAFAQRALDCFDAGVPVLFWLSALLGVLSHFLFVHFYAAIALGSSWHLWQTTRDPRRTLRGLAALHAVPVAGMAILYLMFIRGMYFGGGQPRELVPELAKALAWTLGGPARPAALPALAAAAAAVLLLDVVILRRSRSDLWIFDAIVVLVMPALTIDLLRISFLAPRYWIFSIAFLLPCLARVLAWGFTRGRIGVILSGATLALFCAGNAVHFVRFVQHGRGGYSAAVRHMAADTAGPVTASSDHDFRTGNVLRHYSSALPIGSALRYLPQGAIPPEGTRWYVTHGKDLDEHPPPSLDVGGAHYQLERVFSYYGPSGFHWYLYRRAP